MTKENLIKYLKDPRELILGMDSFCCRRLGKRLIGDKFFIKLKFKSVMGYRINLKNPQTFNEKIRWMILYNRAPLHTKMADKYLAREHIAEVLGREEAAKYLVPLLGVWDSFEEINFDALPDAFVLKCTHDSGSVVMCADKNTFDEQAAKEKLTQALATNAYLRYREWHMKDIRPRIVAELFLGARMTDYKLFCFNGKVRFAQARFHGPDGVLVSNKYTVPGWDYMRMTFNQYPSDESADIPRPGGLAEMVEISETLARTMPFLRVDFYYMDGKVYLGELTLTPIAGFLKSEPDMMKEWGSWLTLPARTRAR